MESKSFKDSSSWGFDFGMGIGSYSVENRYKVLIINIYGPYSERKEYWDNFFTKSFLHNDLVIIGGDLNFTLGAHEM